jgi:hypothetical protein
VRRSPAGNDDWSPLNFVLWLRAAGVEVTDPMNLDKGAAAIALRGSHSRVINCFVHDTATGHGIVAPTGAEGQVVYGNIVSRTGIASARPDEEPTDGIRVGNAASFGAKYVADNMLIGFNALCDKCRGLGVHANPTTAAAFAVDRASAVVVEGNIFDRSQATIGGSGAPAEQNVVNENWFAASELQLGQASPTQTEVTGNVIAWSYLDSRYIWVDGDAAYGAPAKPTVIRGNSVFFAPVDGDLGRMDDLPVLDLGTAAYVSAADKEKVGARPVLGNAPLPGSLQVDQNTFGGNSTFFRLGAGGVKDSAQTIEAWRTLTGNAGKAVDASSSVVAPPTATLVVTRKNLYSPYLQYVVVFNYGNATNATVPLREFATIMSPMKFAVYKASDLWGKPTAEGTLPSTSVDVPLEPNALTASFVVVANGGVDPTFPPKCLDRNSPECEACPRFDEGCLDGPCRAGNTCLTTSLVCNKNICEDPPTAKQMDGGAHQSTLSVWLIVMIISALTTSI